MPLVRISLREGTSPEYRKAIADGVHRAMIEAIAIPPGDRFQVITEHPPGDLIYSPDYLGISRSDRVVHFEPDDLTRAIESRQATEASPDDRNQFPGTGRGVPGTPRPCVAFLPPFAQPRRA